MALDVRLPGGNQSCEDFGDGHFDDDDDHDDDDDGGDGDNDSLRAVTGRKAWVAPVCLSLAPRAHFAPFTEDDQLQVF